MSYDVKKYFYINLIWHIFVCWSFFKEFKHNLNQNDIICLRFKCKKKSWKIEP